MNPEDVIRRLTGLTAPWDSAASGGPGVALAEELIGFLAARRVMYHPTVLETPHHCVSSVFVICDTLTGFIARADTGTVLYETLRGMRGACHKFLATVQADRGKKVEYPVLPGNYGNWIFDTALGELRGVMGVHVAHLAARYSIDVPDALAGILPGRDTDHPI